MKPSIYPVVADYPGLMYIMPKPSGEWLREDIRHYHAMGIGTIVSMLEVAEARELLLQDEQRVCNENGVDFLHLPVPDRGLPDREEFRELLHVVRERLNEDERIAVHCRAGIGRSGMLVCCVLAEFVGSASQAVELVSQARGVRVPDTSEQCRFIESITLEAMS